MKRDTEISSEVALIWNTNLFLSLEFYGET
jgi:hypothetical protein